MAIDKNTITKEAQKFVAKGQFDKAIAEWKKLLKESPNDAGIFNTIGDLCLKKDSKAEAVEAYQKAADLLAADGFTSKAIALYKKVLNIDPKKIEAHLALGDMNAEKGLTGNALESYKVVADYYTQHKETVKALGIYQKMADLNPANIGFRIKLADMYAKQQMKPEAMKAYLQAADVHVSKDAFQEARQLFEKVLALDPNNKEVYHKAGIVYFKEGKFAEACKAFKPAFENDPTNQELVDTYLEALSKAGRSSEAAEVLAKMLEQDHGNTSLREKLYHLYLTSKEYEKALIEASVLADAKAEGGSPEAAEEILRSFVAQSPEFPHGRRRLAEFYASHERPADAASELLKAADLLIQTGDEKRAKAVLGRALEIVPHMPEAQDRLDSLMEPAAPPPPPEPVATPSPKPAVSERRPAAPVQKAPLEMPAASAALPIAGEDDPAINEALTEADVLIKYGLMPKATEQLEALSSKFPESPRIRIRLRDLYQEQGNIDKAVRHALLAVALYTKFNRTEEANDVLQAIHALAPDHPAVSSRMARASAAAPAPPASTFPSAAEEITFEPRAYVAPAVEAVSPPETHATEDLSGNLEIEEAVPSSALSAFDAFEEKPSLHDLVPTGEIEFEGLGGGIPQLEEAEEAFPAPAVPEQEQTPAIEFPEEVLEPQLDQHAAAAGPAMAAEPTPASAPPEEADVSEIWAEAEFYFQQGLFDEAKKHYAKIISLTPSDRRAIDRLSEISREEDETQEFSKLAEAVDDLESAITTHEPAIEMAMTSSDEEAVRSLMQEIQQLKQEKPHMPAEETGAPPSRAAQPGRRPEPMRPTDETRARAFPPPPKQAEEEDFFDLGEELEADSRAFAAAPAAKSDDFFDLAAELRDELSNVTVPSRSSAVPAEEQSLDDIFEEFKKGVEQQAVKEDADTHYNLGVAYKEMGLLDDAIAEFIMTPEDESKFIQSRYMLGLCYMEKSEYRNAIGEIQNALDYAESLGGEDLNSVGMHYDLGLAFQGAGNNENALREFRAAYDADPRYRDAGAKIKELQQGSFVSIDQIKDDIEKEISSKFLAEGERIEREEKIRKVKR